MRDFWATIVERLQLRSREERTEYVEMLMRPATKRDIVELLTFSFGVLAIVFGLSAVIALTLELLEAGPISWRAILVPLFAGVGFLLVYIVLVIRNAGDE
jgi:hypothetical protein